MKSDLQIQTDVVQELKFEPSVSHEHIGVAVLEGIVTLSGYVPSYSEKLAAEAAAQRVSGVKAVVEKIEVNLPGEHKRDDQSIAHAILAQFKWNVEVPEHSVKVTVQDGWVELSGEVDWEYQRATAENCVRYLTGVKTVFNKIAIKDKNVQPETVKQRIEEALKRLALREVRHISVSVDGGKVTLSGHVESNREMQDAKGAAWATPGVTAVENNLRVNH